VLTGILGLIARSRIRALLAQIASHVSMVEMQQVQRAIVDVHALLANMKVEIVK
jgi:hypothetical protein